MKNKNSILKYSHTYRDAWGDSSHELNQWMMTGFIQETDG